MNAEPWPEGVRWMKRICLLVFLILVWSIASAAFSGSKATNIEQRVLILEEFRTATIKAAKDFGFPWKLPDARPNQ